MNKFLLILFFFSLAFYAGYKAERTGFKKQLCSWLSAYNPSHTGIPASSNDDNSDSSETETKMQTGEDCIVSHHLLHHNSLSLLGFESFSFYLMNQYNEPVFRMHLLPPEPVV